MNRPLQLLAALIAAPTLAVGCGDDPEPDPATHCQEADLKAYATGSASGERGTASFDTSSDDDAPGRITADRLRLTLGEASPPGTVDDQPMMLYLTDTEIDDELWAQLDERSTEADLILDVVDASDLPPGEEDTMSVDHLDCAVEDGSICAQVGYDAAGDGVLGDDDEFIYNAVVGDVTIEGFEPVGSTFAMHFDLDIGPNVRVHDDDSTGRLQGCVYAEYDTDAPDGWSLH